MRRGQLRQKPAVFHDAGDVGYEVQMFGPQRRGDGSRGLVGVDVIGLAVLAQRDGGDDGDDALHGEMVKEPCAHAGDLAHQAQVDGRMLFLAAAQQAAVDATEAGRVQPGSQKRLDDGLVGVPRQDHLGNGQRFGVGNAQAVDLHRFDAQACLERGDLLAAAMDDHQRLAGCGRQSADLSGQFFQKARRIHLVAANFDHSCHDVVPVNQASPSVSGHPNMAFIFCTA